ncbi:MAG: CBS domain-containing protein [Desulfurococcales archaeon]|nr:CBS domain-containing protein [Desulfurococcales archaeon]
MLEDPASIHAKSPILSISPDSSLLDAINLMVARGVRRLRVARAGEYTFTTVDSIIRILSEMSKLFTDDRSLRQVRIGSTNLVEPPVVGGDYTIRDIAGVMLKSNVDFVVVTGREYDAIMTVVDIIDAIDEKELDEPALNYASRRYPMVKAGLKLIDAVKMMSSFRVRSVLVVDDEGNVLGAISSKQILKMVSNYGFNILGDDLESSVKPVRAFADPGSTLGTVAKLMRQTGSEIAVLNVGKHVLGIINEFGVLTGISGIDRQGMSMA